MRIVPSAKHVRRIGTVLVVVAGIVWLLHRLAFTSHDGISKAFNLVEKFKPRNDKIRYKSGDRVQQVFTHEAEKFTQDYLNSFLDLNEDEIVEMKSAYDGFLEALVSSTDPYWGCFGNCDNERGIVTIGGGKFSWLALLNILQLRKLGSSLPIEVFIPHNDVYDEEFCDFLARYDAKCIRGPNLKLKSYQWKIIALYYSNFQNILLLDSDNALLKDPVTLFEFDEYLSTGMVMWPDAWTRTTHPSFYRIINSPVENPDSQTKFHSLKGTIPDPTIEAGMVLVDKAKHAKTLFLTLYFNVHGPDYYYPLLTQGGAGEGDKDTFVAAAFALKKPYYIIHNTVQFVGYFKPDGSFHSNALGQCDPMSESEIQARKSNKFGDGCSDLMFLHLSYPKYYIDHIIGDIKTSDRELIMYESLVEHNDKFELSYWEIFVSLLCSDSGEHVSKTLSYVRSFNTNELCNDHFIPHLEFLKKWFKNADRSKSQFEQDL